MKTINGVEYFEESDFWMCKHSDAGTDKDGFTVPCCKLSGLPCEEVKRNGDEGCKYEEEKPNSLEPWGRELEERADKYDR